MNDKYLTDLYEYVGSAKDEQTIISKISDLFSLEKEQVTKLIASIEFADYIELTNAVNSGDKDRIQYIIGKDMSMAQESANSYTATAAVSQATNQQSIEQPQTDDKGSNFSTSVDIGTVDDLQNKDNEDGSSNTTDDGLEEELKRLRELSGIGERQATTTGRVTSTTPSFLNSAAIAGAVMPKNKMKKLTKSPSAKKPGPKTK